MAKPIRKINLILVLLLIISSARAQITDTAYMRRAKDSSYHLKMISTGIFNRTNEKKSFILTNVLGFNIRKPRFEFINLNTWIYGTQNEELSNNDFNSVFNFDFLRNVRRIYYWGLLTYTTSYSLDIEHQAQFGAGLGLNIIRKSRVQLILSDGILYETNNVEDVINGREIYQTWRNSLRLKFKFIMGKTVTLEGASYWQPSLSDGSDYIVQSTTGLSVKLGRWLSFTSTLLYNRFSYTDRDNLLVNFGFTAETYFKKRKKPSINEGPPAL